ncbi:YnjH family protein [Vibrio kyushuensis]|uniref:DUF1496 domain-containing protein n=1 Tax=Vibrio kyushuensis TaxID=2910249 RepID=UPI003D12F822
MKYKLMLLIAVFANPLNAKIISTPGKAIIGVNAADIGKRVCYYQDQAYSLGSILQVGEHYMICKEANDFETNGALKWVPLETSTQTK